MKKALLFFLILSLPLFANAQGNGSILFQELDSLQAIDAKPTIIFLHTDWCRYCKGMEKAVFSDSKVKEEMESGFYFVRFDGESEVEIQFRGVSFGYKPSGRNEGVHELAQLLGSTGGTLSFPTIVVLNKKLEVIYVKDGFMTKPEFLKLLSLVEANEK